VNEFICLAKSHKFEGFCVVGKKLNAKAEWIRPVSKHGKGEIPLEQLALTNGKTLKTGNVIAISQLTHNPLRHQKENYLISDEKWRFIKNYTKSYDFLLDTPKSIWINGFSSTNGKNDRIEYSKAVNLDSSVFFIKVKKFELFTDNGKSDSKLRIKFDYNETKYILRVTDAEYSKGDIIEKISTISVYPYIYLTVSLTQNFTGYCYKLAAAIIKPRG